MTRFPSCQLCLSVCAVFVGSKLSNHYWLADLSPFVPGKLTHSGADQLSGSEYSLVDYNRAGKVSGQRTSLS